MLTRTCAVACGIALLAVGSVRSAEALTIRASDVGSTISYTLVGDTSSSVSAEFDWLITSFIFAGGQTTVTFDVTVENTSTINADLRAFSVLTPGPDAIGGSISGSAVFDNLSVNLAPPVDETFLVCASTSTTENCTGIGGGSDPGLLAGLTDTLTLSLIFAGDVRTSGVVLTEFCGRWQRVGPNFADSDKSCTASDDSDIDLITSARAGEPLPARAWPRSAGCTPFPQEPRERLITDPAELTIKKAAGIVPAAFFVYTPMVRN